MGNDGGSIPTRRELVREAARAPTTAQIKEAQREQQEHAWTTCPLSHKALARPVVSDSVGNLYNKDAVLQFLIPGDDAEGISSKSDCEEVLCGRVKSLRDVVELHFEIDTELSEHPSDRANSHRHKRREGWICPITAKPLGPSVKSVYLVPCGHVFAEEAIRQLKGDKCLQCNESYTEDNIINILPTKETDKERLITRGAKLAEQNLTHSLKKAPGSKKRKKHAAETSTDVPSGTAGTTGSAPAKTAEASNSRSNTSTPTPSASNNGIKNAATASLTARVLNEENEKKKRRKMMGMNDNLDSLFTKDKKDSAKTGDFMTRGFTIPASARR
ncbi:hypothetical protein N7462_006257 [Penicillium macrosclerotiorum]|uniref:uncharacterized protein n=1 Tax=Penicillium macrosclerotiorum TaxID=303699 RepID=UPI002549BACC|nr:uncharacterized protein N7462_006257 [Penicillium macrosclerotiorum]KAJ5683092.1 hypothetical protein N7462_006257 [Penicillium macrosclerotiorum]